MITLGLDLAAEASRTAMAALSWSPGRASVHSMWIGVDDDSIRCQAAKADKIGVDCPFGWPSVFVDMVSAHHRGSLAAPSSSGREWRRRLAMRGTDLDVYDCTGLTPLSVSADRIAHAAMRWAAIAAALAGDGHDCARDGSGLVAEVYPAAALRIWQLPHRGYKRTRNRVVREGLVEQLLRAAPWLDLGQHEATCRGSDDALDAVICALVARAVALDLTLRPPPDSPADAEGWIHLPICELQALTARDR